MPNRTDFTQDAHHYLSVLFADLKDLQIKLKPQWHIDHLCYRSDSIETYNSLKQQFNEFATCIGETPINGRPIATFLLHEPIYFQEHIIRAIELPAPKPQKVFTQGFEHIEVVCDVPLDSLPQLYPQLQWEAFDSKNSKDFNSERKAILNDHTVKFHHQSLQTVVTLENQSSLFSAIKSSNILKDLKPFNPIVVGTFPLGLHMEHSDVDVALSHTNLQEVQETCLKCYSHLPGFQMHTACILERDRLVVRFQWEGIAFELFAQTQPTFSQNGYRHMIIEERLLKVGGSEFFERVLSLRKQGLKTEPAFAEAMDLKDPDAYAGLLALWQETDEQLLARLQLARKN